MEIATYLLFLKKGGLITGKNKNTPTREEKERAASEYRIKKMEYSTILQNLIIILTIQQIEILTI